MAPRGAERLSNLVRMLNLLPYFGAHPERSIMEAARDLGQSPQEIMDDLNRLWCCGLPGLLPGDLVELQHDYTRVKVHNAQGMDQPLRLTRTEAGALLLALENLEQSPGLTDPTAVLSAAAKLRAIMGDQVVAVVDAIAHPVAKAPLESEAAESSVDLIRRAVDTNRKLAFHYVSVNEETQTDRLVSIAHVFTTSDGTYITAWDDARNKHRTFRTDRMSALQLTEEQANPHAATLKFKADDPFAFGRAGHKVTLRMRREALWLADYVPIKLGNRIDDTWYHASVRAGSDQWLQRFVLGARGAIVVEEPTRGVELICERASNALEAYDRSIGV